MKWGSVKKTCRVVHVTSVLPAYTHAFVIVLFLSASGSCRCRSASIKITRCDFWQHETLPKERSFMRQSPVTTGKALLRAALLSTVSGDWVMRFVPRRRLDLLAHVHETQGV